MGVLLFLLIFFFVSFCIVGLVLLQEGKGGGLTGMSTGMDGVMGARNPLRRWTAYLFILFVLLCLIFNLHLYRRNRMDDSLPTGLEIPRATTTLPEGLTLPEGSLRPSEDGLLALPIPADEDDGEETPAGEGADEDTDDGAEPVSADGDQPADDIVPTPAEEPEAVAGDAEPEASAVVDVDESDIPALSGESVPSEENVLDSESADVAPAASADNEEDGDAPGEAAAVEDDAAGNVEETADTDGGAAGLVDGQDADGENASAASPSAETAADDEE